MMAIDKIMELPHHRKCQELYHLLGKLRKSIEEVYQKIGEDELLFKFQAQAIEYIVNLELVEVDIWNDACAKLRTECNTVVDEETGETDTQYTYFDETGEEVDPPHTIGTYLEHRRRLCTITRKS